MCPSIKPPGGLDPKDVPQFILLTHDECVGGRRPWLRHFACSCLHGGQCGSFFPSLHLSCHALICNMSLLQRHSHCHQPHVPAGVRWPHQPQWLPLPVRWETTVISSSSSICRTGRDIV